MQITHPEARRLIQYNMDRALTRIETDDLSTHLRNCLECAAYAEDIQEVHRILPSVMRRQWSALPIPFPTASVLGRRNHKPQFGMILATRRVLIGVICAAFVFSAWQFMSSSSQTSNPLPVGVLPVPTPSLQSTSTKSIFKNCEAIPYTVQEGDTLASIAYQFSVSKEVLMAFNNMQTETVITNTQLNIPICNLTPTGTVHPATYTPSTSPTISTPG